MDMEQNSGSSPAPQMLQHIWCVIGPAGCGKTTVALHLSQQLSLPYLEGDKFHPQANIDKMSQGHPLNDEDRWDWLIKLREVSMSELSKGVSGVVMTCSALKAKYRDVIRIASYHHTNIDVHFIYLQASEETLLARVRGRQGHYMKDDMVHSQFQTLQEPTSEETDCLVVNVSGTPLEVNEHVIGKVKIALEKMVKDVHGQKS